MKKKIIALLLTLIVILSMTITAFAGQWLNNNINSTADLTLQKCLDDVGQYYSWNDYYYLYARCSYQNKATVCPISNKCVLVRDGVNEYGAYTYIPYIYDESTDTISRYYYSEVIDVCIGTSKFYGGNYGYAMTINSFTDEWGNWTCETNAPYCINQEYALLYFQTMDAHYLENAYDYITLNAPKNVSMYLASDENKIYLYYENDDCANPLYTFTHIHYDYSYVDLDGDINTVSSYDDEILFSERNQYGFDLTPLLEYDSSILIGHLYNIEYPFGNGGAEPFTSNRVVFMYTPSNKEVRIIYTDENNNEIFSTSNIITDYRNYRDSYTGGVIIEIPDFNNSFGNDFDLLGGIFDGFGLIGNNGLIGLIASLFSFIPTPIIILWTAGVSIMLIVALFKLLVH